jgi:hypothetical protein
MRALAVAAALALTATSAAAVANPLAPPDPAAAAPPGFLAMPDTRLARIGKYVFIGSYVVAAMVPTFVLAGEALTGGHVNHPPPWSVAPNYLPLAGPFITLSTSGAHTDHGSVFYTAVSIPGQLIGAGLWIYGSARPGTRLVPMENGAMISFAPIGSGGVVFSGRF